MRPLAVVCSKCGSGFQTKCRDKGLDRDDPHRVRAKLARELTDGTYRRLIEKSAGIIA